MASKPGWDRHERNVCPHIASAKKVSQHAIPTLGPRHYLQINRI